MRGRRGFPLVEFGLVVAYPSLPSPQRTMWGGARRPASTTANQAPTWPRIAIILRRTDSPRDASVKPAVKGRVRPHVAPWHRRLPACRPQLTPARGDARTSPIVSSPSSPRPARQTLCASWLTWISTPSTRNARWFGSVSPETSLLRSNSGKPRVPTKALSSRLTSLL